MLIRIQPNGVHKFFQIANMLFWLALAFLALLHLIDARPKCINTIYVLPMLVETSLDSDFAQFRSYLTNCTGKLKAGNEKFVF
jgi:hypothetical protein